MSNLSIIVAMSSNRVIGVNNTLPWHLSEDLKHFKSLTTGHTIIMGRKTYESIGRPLPNRRNIVISRNSNTSYEGVEVVHSLEDAFSISTNDKEVFVIGGSNIYEQALSFVDQLYITEIKKSFIGDAFFPEINKQIWIEYSRDDHVTNDGLEFSFVKYQKNTK
ncbi:MAG TPA: dihydrofolate reductase [Methylophilaceae bacterium]|nr:dihydrofolate reductase [Methylophilaceae bacterium]HCC72975.1 dihydrofolate reductase [Methylophilaceae bacterium]